MRKLAEALIRLAVTVLLALGSGASTALADTLPPGGAGYLQKVRVQLKWTHQFQFAGFYAAIEQGYFRRAGLAVELSRAARSSTPRPSSWPAMQNSASATRRC